MKSQRHSRLAGAIAKVVRDLRTNRLHSHPGVCRAAADDERQFKEGIAPLAGVTRRAAAVVSVVVREHEGNRVSVRLVPPRLSAAPRSATYGLGTNGRSPIQSASSAIGLCNHDQPLCKKSIAPSARLTSSVGYIRLYGHNCQNNFTENPQTASTLEVLYELRIHSMSSQNLYLDQLEPWIEHEDHCQARA